MEHSPDAVEVMPKILALLNLADDLLVVRRPLRRSVISVITLRHAPPR
jgi:hypothetical protein